LTLLDKITSPQFIALLGIPPTTLWVWSRTGRSPRPIKVGPGVTAWRARDIGE
jgi:predicted DNA-binding transcriptional regulator AlpA